MEDHFGTTVGVALFSGAFTSVVMRMRRMISLPPPFVPPVDIENQSIEVPNSGGARQSCLAPLGGVTDFIYSETKTLLNVLERGCRLSDNGQCLGWRGDEPKYNWISYKDVMQRARNVASGLVNIGMQSGQSTFIGIYAQNCVEWILTEHACYNQSAIIVPLYDTLGPHVCSYIINHAEISIVVCDKEERVKSLLDGAAETPGLKQIILIRGSTENLHQQAEDLNIKLHLFKDVEALGKEKSVPMNPCKPEDLSTICYTSGTTGNPKGVMLTHANIVIDASAVAMQLKKNAPDIPYVMFSFLPLAHMFERLCEIAMFVRGGSVGFYRGDLKLLTEDLQALKPTILIAVPRVLNKIYDQVYAKVNKSIIKKYLLNLALRSKKSEIQRRIFRFNGIWDQLIFKKVREALGGQIALLVCGSAPVAEDVITFIRCALSCAVVEGYGQTECVAPCTVNIQGDPSVGQVGPPIPCCHIKLVDVPEMEYFSSKGEGEVCVKGGIVFKGYLKDPQKTAETIDKDGWLHTGDIGMWLPNGTLKIIDRKKHIFKLSQGEYIAPEKIENIYFTSPFISQIYIHGESLQSCLVAIVDPDMEVLENWCRDQNIKGSWKEICENEVVKNAILTDMISLGKKAGLKSFEQVKDIYLHPEPFTIENGLLTPTLKTKRETCRKYFMKQIEDMYKSLT